MLYNVYLWKELASQEAGVVQAKRAGCADQAILRVMKDNGLPYVHYAWAVPQNDRVPCTERFTVRCAAVPLVRR